MSELEVATRLVGEVVDLGKEIDRLTEEREFKLKCLGDFDEEMAEEMRATIE